MRKLFVGLSLVLVMLVYVIPARAAAITISNCSLDAVTTTCPLPTEQGKGIVYHKLSWSLNGTNTGSSTVLQYSDNNGLTWTTLITATTTASGVSAVSAASVHNSWRLLMTGFTATSVGANINVTNMGYDTTAGDVTSASVTITSGTVDTVTAVTSITNPVTVAQATAANLNATVTCTNCSGGTTDSDDGSVAGAQSTGLSISLGHFWDGSVWRRFLGNTTDGLLVNLGANNDVTVTSGSVTAVSATASNLKTAATLDAETTKVIGTVNVAASQTIGLAAGSAVVGHVINDASSAVIGHVIVDSGGGGGSTAQGATTSGITGGLSMGNATTSAPTYTTGTTNGLSLTTTGDLRVATPGIVYNSTQPTKTDGQTFTDMQVTNRGELKIDAGVSGFNSGTAAANISKAEDGTPASGDTIVIVGGIVQATPTATASDGKYAPPKLNPLGITYTQAVNPDGTSAAVTDPCDGLNKTPKSFSISSATTTVLVAASASNKLYVCSFDIVVATANNVALVEDASGSCASPDAGIAGGVTAATGWNFAANGGLIKGSGAGTVFKTASTNVNVCLMTSGSGQTSGSLTYVLAP